MLEKKKKSAVKGVSKSGVGADAKRVSTTRKMGEKGIKNYYDQNSSHAIKRGKDLVI